MKNDSIRRKILDYVFEIFDGLRSVLAAVSSTLPYLFSLGELRKESTEQYPDPVSSRTEDDLPPRSRGILFNDIDRCTGCGDCVKVCPTSCIDLKTDPGPSQSKKWVNRFDIDIGNCLFCGVCVEACEPQSLTHTKQYEAAVYELSDLIRSFGRGEASPGLKEKWAKFRDTEEYAN